LKTDVALLLILTAVLWGTTPVLEKIGLGKTDPITGLTIRSIAITLALLVYLAVAGRVKEIFRADAKTIIIFSTTGLLAGLLGMVTYFYALKKGATSQIVPIAAAYPLVSALLSVIILRENVTPMRVLGTVLIVAGIWFVRG